MSLILIALALAMDALAISIVYGSQYKNMPLYNALKIALFFGLFQILMPLIGYFAGSYITVYVQMYEPYIVFIILVSLGYDMIKHANDTKKTTLKTGTLLLLALATSIDALAVGFTFSLEHIHIWFSIFIIGSFTFLFSLLGIYLGKKLGTHFENKAEYLGGVILIILGIEALISQIH